MLLLLLLLLPNTAAGPAWQDKKSVKQAVTQLNTITFK
jgi:hypothetical protein